MSLWLPETKAFEAILNRNEADQHVSQHLQGHTDALRALVDYGTHLIPRCWVSSKRTMRDVVILPVLLKQVVSMLDAGSELMSRACVEPAMLQLRAAFEASVYLDWILGSRVTTRARAYYVWNIRRGLRWANRGLIGTPEYKAFAADMKGLSITSRLSTPEKQKELAEEVSSLQKHLSEPKNVAWNKRFEAKRKRQPYDVEWYQVLFKKKQSLRSLAKSTKRMPEYRLVYELGSEVMHSSTTRSHVRVLEGGKLEIRSLRELTDYPFVFQMLITTGLHVYTAVLQAYRPGEAQAFARTYVDTWRNTFMGKLTIEYDHHPVTIG